MIKLTSFFDRKFLIYIAVGVGNTILGVTLMFLLYSKAGVWILAYSVSRPIVFRLLCRSELPVSAVEKTSMLVGMGIFTVISYMGQRFFVFRDTDGRAISR